jgi:hypothetical protein
MPLFFIKWEGVNKQNKSEDLPKLMRYHAFGGKAATDKVFGLFFSSMKLVSSFRTTPFSPKIFLSICRFFPSNLIRFSKGR